MAFWPVQMDDEYLFTDIVPPTPHDGMDRGVPHSYRPPWPFEENTSFTQWHQHHNLGADLQLQISYNSPIEVSNVDFDNRMESSIPKNSSSYISNFFPNEESQLHDSFNPPWGNMPNSLSSPPINMSENPSSPFTNGRPLPAVDVHKGTCPTSYSSTQANLSPFPSSLPLPKWSSSSLSPPMISPPHPRPPVPKKRSKVPETHRTFPPTLSSSSPSSSPSSPLKKLPRPSKASTMSPARKHKDTHKLIEKKYRNRLNSHFKALLSAISRKDAAFEGEGEEELDRRMSKGKVLVLAVEHIRALEMRTMALEKDRERLVIEIEMLRSGC